MKRFSLPFAALAVLLALPARAADADATGLVPTVWFDFEAQPDASGLPDTNKGSVGGFSFTSEGTETYQAGANGGYALDTSAFRPYSSKGNAFSTAGGPFTLSLVMNLGTTANGITLNLRNETGQMDLIVRRGSTSGSLVVGCDVLQVATRHNLQAMFEDDSAWHLVSVVVKETDVSLYVDGVLADSMTDFTLWSATGCASRFQFGSHLGGIPNGEARGGGCIDDLRIHNAALTPIQIRAIAAEYGLSPDDGFISIAPSGDPTVGKDSFRTPFSLLVSEGHAAEVAIVHGTDAALSAPATNVVGSVLSAGSYTASLTGLASGTTYWWKLVASNDTNRAETDVASFRTLDEVVATDFSRRVPIAVPGYAGSSTLTNFPVLVKLAAGSPAGFDYADCAADGSDLRFADADGLLLHHEIDTWDPAGTSFVWVKVPELSGTDTAFSMYYGASDPTALPPVDPRSVWAATGHRAVWHFAADETESAQGLVPSSATGTPSYDNAGAVGKCWQSAGTAWLQYANNASWSALGEGSTVTISAWARHNGAYSYNRILSTMSNWMNPAGYELTVQNEKNQITVGSSDRSQYQKVVSPGPMDELVYLTAVYNADGYADLYANGVLQEHKQLNRVVQPTEELAVASTANGNSIWNGLLDELRLHAAAESADWIRACYETMADPTSFVSLSPAESTDPGVPGLGALVASDVNGTVTFSVSLARPGYGGAAPTSVSVFYGTDGETWTELYLGATNEAATLTGSASGFAGEARVLWFATATATQDGADKTATSPQLSFVTRALDPVGNYKSFTATVDWDGAPAANVPVLLRLSETAILGFSYADVTASGLEILDADGHRLPFETDTWNTNGESFVWVRLPDYRDGATLTVRYGTAFANAPLPATDVWTGYAGVWHMGETYDAATAATGLSHDSTANGLDATPTNGGSGDLAQMVSGAGVVGNARVNATSATATGNYLSVPSYDSLELGGTFAVSGWFKATNVSGYPRLFSRKESYDGGNGWEIENANGDARKFSARGASSNAVTLDTPTYANAWLHVALVYDGATLTTYANGEPCGSGTIAAATDNGQPLSFGNNSNGSERSFAGLYDEIRLLDATPSASWIAAEYHAMADDGALAFSAVSSSDTAAPVLGTPSVVRDANGSFIVSVAVSENLPDTIFCSIDGTDYAMTSTDASVPAMYSATVSNLSAGTHTTTVRASSASGTTVSAACPTAFHAGALVAEVLADADEATLSPGAFRISRADADATDLPALTFDVAFSGDGLAAIVAPTATTITIPAGAAYVDIPITPVATDAVDADAEIVLVVSGAAIGQSSTATMTVLNAGFDTSVRYVSAGGSDENHGGTPELPKKTIGSAVASLANVAQSRICTVHVAPGLYKLSAPIVVTNAIGIFGDDPDPSRVVVSNLYQAGWAQNFRVFEINHADALVANLTMQKGSVGGDWTEGANFCIGSAGGTVSNCVVEAGEQRTNHAHGGGGSLGAGLVTHTVFRKNNAPDSSPYSPGGGNRAAVLHLYGSSRAENCLLVDNPQSKAVVLVRLADSALMRNCTIVDSGIAKTNENCKAFSAIRIDGSNASVVNTVVAGVTNTVDGAACPPTGTVANFVNGAFDGDATGLPEGTVVGTEDAFFPNHARKVPFAARYRPKAGGPLAEAGANYDNMALYDLSGEQKRLIGPRIDIGCYEASGAGTVIIVK